MNLWDKREDESKKAYKAFCDYRDMGEARSLRALHDKYIEPSCNNAITKSRSSLNTWSANHDWQNRVDAWDEHMLSSQTQSREDAVQELLDSELRDYNVQLEKWTEAYRRTPLHEVQYTADDGRVFVKMNHDDLYRMAKWRDEIAKQGRRALGLPEKVTEKHTQGDINLNVTWDTDLGDDDLDDIGIGADELPGVE